MGYRSTTVHGDTPAKIYVDEDLSRKVGEAADPIGHFKKITEQHPNLFRDTTHSLVFIRDSELGVVVDVYTSMPRTDNWAGEVLLDHSQFHDMQFERGGIEDMAVKRIIAEEEELRATTTNLDMFLNMRPIPEDYRELLARRA